MEDPRALQVNGFDLCLQGTQPLTRDVFPIKLETARDERRHRSQQQIKILVWVQTGPDLFGSGYLSEICHLLNCGQCNNNSTELETLRLSERDRNRERQTESKRETERDKGKETKEIESLEGEKTEEQTES